ncbi:uncharacterized protein LOC126834631 [Adelges cooleyi]|uniref:uncharacterized protein LOC126834631 n=1 Tax=Adelges cooleyi TaxID=133065 RepID=UPI002180256B|nr:uncharacterized protein LOC126834631 [Adelges cooleyi]
MTEISMYATGVTLAFYLAIQIFQSGCAGAPTVEDQAMEDSKRSLFDFNHSTNNEGISEIRNQQLAFDEPSSFEDGGNWSEASPRDTRSVSNDDDDFNFPNGNNMVFMLPSAKKASEDGIPLKQALVVL